MKKIAIALLLSITLLPCLSQKPGAEIAFRTSEGKTYYGTVTDVSNQQSKLFFTGCGFTIDLSNEALSAMKEAKKKTCFTISNEVERLLKQEAAALLDQLFKACSFTNDAQHKYRFCRINDRSLYLFYTSPGYDYATIDYHIIKLDLSSALAQSLFSQKPAAKKAGSRAGLPVVEIAKHTSVSTYREDEFFDSANWNNQPEHKSTLELYFIDEQSTAFQKARDSFQKTFDFLFKACQR